MVLDELRSGVWMVLDDTGAGFLERLMLLLKKHVSPSEVIVFISVMVFLYTRLELNSD